MTQQKIDLKAFEHWTQSTFLLDFILPVFELFEV